VISISNSPKIIFVINSIGRGGAEPSLFKVMEYLNNVGFPAEIHLITLDDVSDSRKIPPNIIRHRLDAGGSLRKSIFMLSRALNDIKPNLIVSFLARANVSCTVCARIIHVPNIICERMHLSSHLRINHIGFSFIASWLAARLTYPFSTHAIGVSAGVTSDLQKNFGVSRSRSTTILNSYDIDKIHERSETTPERYLPHDFIISVGRLVKNKNFEDLIIAFGKQSIERNLVICGEGENRSKLQDLIDQYQLNNRVFLLGHLQDPVPVMARAKYFISTSINEGFPNAMVEAMILGLPIIASNCLSGPAEILHEDCDLKVSGVFLAKHGILIEPYRVDAIIHAMEIMSQPDNLTRYAQSSVARASMFGERGIIECYGTLFSKILTSAA